jgi:hypothetical protein
MAGETLLAPIEGAERREVGGVQVDAVRTGAARVKRIVYQPGFRWSTHMQPITKTALCDHAHVGFLAQGQIRVEYPDGCVKEYTAPAVVSIEPGHDGGVVGDEPAVLIEIDFESNTVERLGMPERHRH